jgi:hypothetical protein
MSKNLVAYFPSTYPGIDEIAVYPHPSREVSSIITFKGNRATKVEIPEFMDYIQKYEPCVAYRDIPDRIVTDFILKTS